MLQTLHQKETNTFREPEPLDTTATIASKRLFELYCAYKTRRFIFVEPWGNYGDQLIWRGAEKLAALAGLEFEPVKFEAFIESTSPDDAVIYIHGGGGIHPNWSGSALQAFLKAVDSHPGVTILGPQTVPDDTAFVRRTIVDPLQRKRAGKAFIFTRERTSHATLKTCLPGWIELQLDHDTALNLTPSDLAAPDPAPRFPLYAIRRDKEATGAQRRDLLAIRLDPPRDCFSFDHWVSLHRRAKAVVANRLHSAIAGSILGVPTTLLPNNYHKNRSVWEHSLQQRGVKWADAVPLGRVAQTVNAVYPVRYLLAKPAFQAALRKFIYKVRYKT